MFTPPYIHIGERVPWQNRFYNDLVVSLQAFLANLNGTDLAAPFTLSRSGQHLHGGDHNIHGFRKWLGYGSADVCLRDVTGYGAKGDGATDDILAIQAAIDDLPASGGVILFPPGTYVVSGTVRMAGTARNKANTTLAGFGEMSRIYRKASSGNGPMIEMGATEAGTVGQTLLGLDFHGNGHNQAATQTCINLADTTRARILGCSVHDSKQDGISVYGSVSALIQGCRAYNNLRSGIVSGSVERPASDLTISGCELRGNTGHGIHLGPLSGALIEGCQILQSTLDGIRIQAQSSMAAQSLTIAGNMIGSCAGIGIHILNEYAGGAIQDLVIVGNHAHANTSHGLALIGNANCKIRRFSISGNELTSNFASGLWILGPVEYGTISANMATNNAGADLNGGIVIDGTSEDEKAQYLSLVGNGAHNDGGGQSYGILLKANTGSNVVIGNSTYGNSTKNIEDLGVDNDVAHNAGF